MILQELLQRQSWEDIKEILPKKYPTQLCCIDDYRKIFKRLQKETPILSNNALFIKYVLYDEPGFYYYDEQINIRNHKNGTINREITSMPWNEIIGLTIDSKTMRQFGELDIVIHCLYAMTTYGFTEAEICEYYKILKHN